MPGIERCDLLGEGTGAAAALWLALAAEAETGAVVLAAPDDLPDEASREMRFPVLVLSGPKDGSAAAESPSHAAPRLPLDARL